MAMLALSASCSHPLDPATATFAGTVMTRDGQRLGIRSDEATALSMPPGFTFDYLVTVSGPVYHQRADGSFVPASLNDIPNGVRVAVWLKGGVMDSFPGQATAAAVAMVIPRTRN